MDKPTSDELMTAIRAHCLDCSGGSRRDVHRCKISHCKLWPYRKPLSHKKIKSKSGQMTIFDFMEKEA